MPSISLLVIHPCRCPHLSNLMLRHFQIIHHPHFMDRKDHTSAHLIFHQTRDPGANDWRQHFWQEAHFCKSWKRQQRKRRRQATALKAKKQPEQMKSHWSERGHRQCCSHQRVDLKRRLKRVKFYVQYVEFSCWMTRKRRTDVHGFIVGCATIGTIMNASGLSNSDKPKDFVCFACEWLRWHDSLKKTKVLSSLNS